MTSSVSDALPPKRNAFSELMSPKKKQPKEDSGPKSRMPKPHDVRNGLSTYIQNPAASDQVITFNDDMVLIHDLYPKSIIHLLLLPRDMSKTFLHPHEAFADAQFLAMVRREAEAAVKLATSELRRSLANISVSEQARMAALENDLPPSKIPSGRDFAVCLKVGIHAHPSMNHLHVHIISEDMYSPCLKHRKHYNSFNTSFFVPLADYPLAEDDPRRQISLQNANLQKDFKCWRCGRMFGNKFAQLKQHLDDEYEEWKKE